jgi:hypothetical protein
MSYSTLSSTTSILLVVAMAVFHLLVLIHPAHGRESFCSCGPPVPNSFLASLPNGESYDSYYSWITSNGLLTEGAIINPKWVAQDVNPNIVFQPNDRPCAVNLTFVSSVANTWNRVGTFLYDKNAPVGQKIIPGTMSLTFPAITTTEDPNPCLAQGTTVTLGPFDSSMSMGFFLDINGACWLDPLRLYSLDEENLKYDTSSWNAVLKPYGRSVAVLQVPTVHPLHTLGSLSHKTENHLARVRVCCVVCV